ncbi:hypothetical protein GWI33_011772 [Rhynchophorus ferrugineus]|uniref:Uncharacterized protein n=1 Tax=Rhynchophorus ferrugineus TaxID=354439 RepID=A0A834MBB9_RHYFE|nr:hypothetical protein GWI33_011772 [Rhynchophorus ferrugineus]
MATGEKRAAADGVLKKPPGNYDDDGGRIEAVVGRRREGVGGRGGRGGSADDETRGFLLPSRTLNNMESSFKELHISNVLSLSLSRHRLFFSLFGLNQTHF